jgi:hypothetical protein
LLVGYPLAKTCHQAGVQQLQMPVAIRPDVMPGEIPSMAFREFNSQSIAMVQADTRIAIGLAPDNPQYVDIYLDYVNMLNARRSEKAPDNTPKPLAGDEHPSMRAHPDWKMPPQFRG